MILLIILLVILLVAVLIQKRVTLHRIGPIDTDMGISGMSRLHKGYISYENSDSSNWIITYSHVKYIIIHEREITRYYELDDLNGKIEVSITGEYFTIYSRVF